MSVQTRFYLAMGCANRPLATCIHSLNQILRCWRFAIFLGFACISSQVTAQGYTGFVDLSLLAEGSNSVGFVLNGEDSDDVAGTSVNVIGDINGDGIDDLFIGAPRAVKKSGSTLGVNAGVSYVLFGQSAGDSFPLDIDLASVAEGDGSDGFVIYGEPTGSSLRELSAVIAGTSSSGGDLNGDGVDDLVLGGNDLAYRSGSVYVVYGRTALSGGFPSEFELDDLITNEGTDGFIFRGAGRLPAKLGDLNGDGVVDLYAAAADEFANSYVIFGRGAEEDPFPAEIDSTWIREGEGDRGFEIGVTREFDEAGYASDFGDVNGDGNADLVFSAPSAQPDNLSRAGEIFVIYGRDAVAENFPERVSLTELARGKGDVGFVIRGTDPGVLSGLGLAVGDINGDGVDDIAIGAPGADPGGRGNAGATYILFGRAGEFNIFPQVVELSSLVEGSGESGFIVNGAAAQDQSGTTLSIGDFNGDALMDLVVGTKSTSQSTGRAYVVYGSTAFANQFELASLTEGQSSAGFVMSGLDPISRTSSPIDNSGKSFGAGDVNGDGIDDVIVGDSQASPAEMEHAGRVFILFGELE